MLTTTTVSHTNQPVANKPVTFPAGGLASSTPLNLPLDSSRQAADPPQTAGQTHPAPITVELSVGNMNVSTWVAVPTNSFNQVTDVANFADSGKSLPPSMTFAPVTPAATHTSNIPLTDTADTAANDAPAIATEFGQPDWPEEFGRKITWLATQRMQAAELKLHPAHLGPIEISLQLSGDQQLTAQFVSHHPAVREAIEANLPRLREIMAENGITLADTSVSADTPQQQAENGQDDPFRHPAASDHFPYDSTSPQTPVLQVTRRSSLIDTFA
jgi:flagellar hook-length control protein FliK